MTPKKILLGFLICVMGFASQAQTDVSAPVKNHKWTMYAGIGPNYYFNNLVIAKNRVNELNYTFVGRIMWEPEYFLSLGFESGYNKLYTLDESVPGKGSVHISNVIVPLHFVISMKFCKNFYGNFNMGSSILFNNVTTSNFGNFDGSLVSLGDFAASVGYRRNVSDRFLLGVELKGYYSTKLEDKNISLLFMGGYRLW